jgi:TATA-binding protein-associated factor Taf7
MPSSPTHASSSTHHPPFARDDAQRVETENDDDEDEDDENDDEDENENEDDENENENVVCTNSVIIIRKKKRGEIKRTDTRRTR